MGRKQRNLFDNLFNLDYPGKTLIYVTKDANGKLITSEALDPFEIEELEENRSWGKSRELTELRKKVNKQNRQKRAPKVRKFSVEKTRNRSGWDSEFQRVPKVVDSESNYTVMSGNRVFHKKDIAFVPVDVAKEIVQRKASKPPKTRKEKKVFKSNATGKFTNADDPDADEGKDVKAISDEKWQFRQKMLKKAEEEKEKEKLVKKIEAENEANHLRRQEVWTEKQLANPNLQQVQIEDDQQIGQNTTTGTSNPNSNANSRTKSPTKKTQQKPPCDSDCVLGSSSSPINQTATPTSNLINTAIAMGAANTGNCDSNSLISEAEAVENKSELVRKSSRIPNAKSVVKYCGVSYR